MWRKRVFMQAAFAAAVLTAAGVCCRARPLTYALPEETATLQPGLGMDRAQNNCVKCHAFDYISRQPPNRGKAFWEAEVTKMIKAYHAPISEADAKIIVEYLAKTY